MMWLTVYEMILCCIDLIVLARYAVPIRRYYRWLDFLPGAGVIVSIVSVSSGDTTILGMMFYSLTLILFICTVKQLFKPAYSTLVPKHRIVKAILCIGGVIPIVIALMYAGELRYNPVSHFSKMSYSQAFEQLNERLSREYPFGEWKQVNWKELEDKYKPVFQKAEQDKNKDLYYKTLREYLFSFRDGHIKIENENLYDNNKVFKNEAGGGFGISTVQLDNGKVLVDLVLAGSPAEQSGMKLGTEIVAWDGTAVKEAYRSTFWSESPPATEGDRIYNQGRFMVRAPIGKEIQVEYKNMGESQTRKVTLKAYDDNYETLKETKVKLNKADAPIEGRLLSNGYGYVKIRYFLSSETIASPEKWLKEKLKWFQEQRVKGLIIDVRDNPGGSDDLVSSMAGFFVDKKRFYEYVSYYNRITGKFEINSPETRTIKPAAPYYAGKIAILVNNRTKSSGEGLPILLKGLPNVKIVGFTASNGSFGVITSPIQVEMPEGYHLIFPDGRSLNQDKVIQGDSDYSGHGGETPDIKVPLNELTFKEMYIQGQDVELNYAIEALENMK
ncbi:S41 family peptidase [Paenibacillus sp. BAC0078]